MLWPGLRLCSNGFFTPSSSSTHSTTIYTEPGRRCREDSVINLGGTQSSPRVGMLKPKPKDLLGFIQIIGGLRGEGQTRERGDLVKQTELHYQKKWSNIMFSYRV